jgi:pilus assembly protein CpaC
MATRLTRLFFVLGLSLSATALALPAQAQVNGGPRLSTDNLNIEMNIGEQRVLPAQGVKSYSEGVRGVVDVRLTGDASRFVMVGTAKGATTLLLLMVDGTEKQYSIIVRDPRDTGAVVGPANPFAVAPQASIRLDLYFVQVNRTRSLDFGMNVPSVLGNGVFSAAYNIPASALIAKNAVVSAQFLPSLEAAQGQGWAKISRHVAVITTNGTQADFDSGGEFNAPSSQGLVAGVVSIRYGTNLTIQPRYDETSGRIELQVAAQVSDLTPGAPLPGRTQSKVATIANLALGESLAVAGLASANQESNRVGLPWLSQIPILGLLFSKESNKASDTENLVFISPSVVEPLKHVRAREFLANAFREYDDFEGKADEGKVFPGVKHQLPAQPAVRK